MSVKKTGSPFASGADPLDQLASNDAISKAEKAEKSFESVLAEAAADLNQAGEAKSQSKLQSEFRRIAGRSNFDSPEGEAEAIRESASVLVHSRLNKDFQKTRQGKQIAEKLSQHIAGDPYLHRKLKDILQQLK